MNEYQVTIPIAGAAFMTVHAESEEDAINQALESCHLDDNQEWEPLRHIAQGNVCYAPVWDAVAEDCGPVDEESEPTNPGGKDELA